LDFAKKTVERKQTADPTAFKEARSTYRAIHHQKHPDLRPQAYRRNICQALVRHARARAALVGVAFDITKEDIHVPAVCPLLGIPIRVANRRNDPHSPTIDRIVPALGYVRGNVWVISFRANQLKNDGTPEEHEMIARGVRERIAARDPVWSSGVEV
jgi:hypothetical protein